AYTSEKPTALLDELGSKQLYRVAAKLLVLCALDHWQPEIEMLPALHWFLRPYVVIYLILSSCADFASALSNWAGYYMPNAFDAPFLAKTPFEFWRKWNIPMLF